MDDILLASRKKRQVIPVDENVVFLSHFDQSPPVNVATNEVGTIVNVANYRVSVPQDGPPNSKFGSGFLAYGGSVSGGASEYLTFPKSFNLAARNFTIEAWHRWNQWFSGSGATQHGWTIGYGNSNGWSAIQLTGARFNGAMQVAVNTINGTAALTLSLTGLAQALPVTDYFHVAIIREDGELRGYLNGKLAGSVAIGNGAFYEGDVIRLANSSNAYQPGCSLDEMRIVMDQALYSGASFTVPTGPFPDPVIG